MRASMENPLVLFATAVGGFILAVLLLFLMVGGGFFLALLVLALLPVALAVLAVESIFQVRPVEIARTVPAPTSETSDRSPAPALGRSLALGIICALALLGVYSGLMVAVQGWNHLMSDISQHVLVLVLVLAGLGTLVGLVSTSAAQRSLHKGGVLLAVTGTLIAALALQSCCLVPLIYWFPGVPDTLPSLAVALYINQVPVAVVGIIANVLGISWVIALAQQTQPQSVAG